MPRRVSVCVRPDCSTPPHIVLVVHHLPCRTAVCVGPNYSISARGACGHCTLLHGFRGRRAHLRGWCALLYGWCRWRVHLWRGWSAPHGGQTVVLGSSHPSFVEGSVPILHNPENWANCAARVPSVGLRARRPLRTQSPSHQPCQANASRSTSSGPLGAGSPGRGNG